MMRRKVGTKSGAVAGGRTGPCNTDADADADVDVHGGMRRPRTDTVHANQPTQLAPHFGNCLCRH
jgi:hypothetical protein